MVTTAGKIVIFVGFLVLMTGLFVTMSTLVGLFMILAGIVTMIQGANMKPLPVEPKPELKQAEPKTYTLQEPKKDTKGALGNINKKGAV